MKSSPVTAVPVAAAQTADPSDDTQEIREQIERTRGDMGRTIDELQERLSPQHMMQQAKDSVHDATVGRVKEMVSTASDTARDTAADVAERAQDTASMLADEVRSHPVTTALLGAGVVWLLSTTSMFQRRSYDTDGYGPSRAGLTGPGTAYAGGAITYRTAGVQGDDDMTNGNRQGGWTDVLRDHPVPTALAALGIGYLVMQRDSGGQSEHRGANRDQSRRYGNGAWDQDRASERSRGYGDAAYATASDAREAVGEFSEDVQERWQTMRRRTSSEFGDWMEENPLAVGAAALAAGLALGFTTPRTRFEDEHIGPTRDKLVERGSEVAEDAAQAVTERVKTAAASLDDDNSSSSSAHEDSSAHLPATSATSGRPVHTAVP